MINYILRVLPALALAACAPRAAPVTTTTGGGTPAARAAATPPAAIAAPIAAPDSAWPVAGGGSDSVSTPRYNGAVRTSRYIAMRDGVRLAIDVFLPRGLEAGARLPTILEQTRYRRSMQFRPELRDSLDRPNAQLAEFVTRGYAYVVVDVRGSGASFGSRDIELGPVEVRDGSDVVDWIVSQPWSDGKVGATGVSYVGSTAELLLANRHPAVKAIAPRFALLDTYTDISMPGGVPNTGFLSAWAQTIAAMDRNELSERAQRVFLGTRPVDGDSGVALLAKAVREHANPDVAENLRRVAFRDDTALAGWTLDEISPHPKLDDIRASGAAIYSYSGWYDGAYPRAAALRFRAVRTPGSRLILGPWNHGGASYYSPSLGSRPSSFSHTRELFRFFDHHLKGINTGIADESRVHYYTMGEERWKTANAWPIPETQTESWYLAAGGVLSPSRSSGEGMVDTYRVDTTTTTGNRSRWNTLVGGGPVDYPDRRAEDLKLLTYTSAPLERDLEVTGHPVVTLFISSSATDGAFFVYLEEVDEAGQVHYVTEGELRAVHRKLSDDAPPYASIIPYRSYLRRDSTALIPGQVAELTFDLIPTSYLFRRGRRIRLALAGADMNHFAVIPAVPPTVRLHRDSTRASRIALPVIAR